MSRGATTVDAQPRPLSFYGLLGIVLLAPLPIGVVAQWAWASLALAAAALLCLWGWDVLRGAPVPRFGPFMPALICFGAVLIWAGLQAWSGMPGSMHHPFWELAGPILGEPPPARSQSTRRQP